MKRMIAGLAALMAIFLCGCGESTTPAPAESTAEMHQIEAAPPTEAPTPTPEPTALERVAAKGVLTVAVSPDYAPYEFKDESDTLLGSDIELAKYLAAALGVTVEFQEASAFTEVFTLVEDGKADIALSCIADTAERRSAYALSDQYGGTVTEPDAAAEPTVEPTVQPEETADPSASPEAPLETPVPTAEAVAMENGMVIAAKAGDATLIDALNPYLAAVNRDGLYDEWLRNATMRADTLGLLD